MKKILALILALAMVLVLGACGSQSEAPAEEPAAAPAAEGTYTVTFSTGETYQLPAGEDLVFFFQCDSPGDMGAPNDGEEGAGITVSEGTVTYSNVGLGGPFSYPTSELVTVTGITGDITVTVTDAALAMNATYHIYFDEQEIADAIALAEEMAAQMAANPIDGSGEASGETEEASGEASGPATSGNFEIELNGEIVAAHFEETGNGDDGVKLFEITIADTVYSGTINMGEWTADNEADQGVIDAVRAEYEAVNVVGPSGEPEA